MENATLSNGLTDIKKWKELLGLYPSELFRDSKKQFVLLNGNSNSFCIDFESKFEPEQYISFSWSADVESFVSLDKDHLYLYKWFNQNKRFEIFDKDFVKNNLSSFYEYLGKTKYNKDSSIVTFMMNVFRGIRNILKDKEGTIGLKALLHLLAIAYQGGNIEIGKWGLDEVGKQSILNCGTNIIDRFLEELSKGLPHKELKPNIDLMLRHSAGKLFEEAHYEALLNPQLDLWGLPNRDIKILENSKKSLTGVYFTPPFIARSIVEECLRYYNNDFPSSITIFDPACGSGEFLKESIRQLNQQRYKGKIKIIGWDVSESAIDMAKFITHFERIQSGNANIELSFRIVEDSLKEEWPKDVHVILMNPPYLSWELMNRDERQTVKEVLQYSYKGNPNMASAFLWKAVNSLKSGSMLGCVVPSSLFYADAYEKLRIEIEASVSNKLVGKLGNYIFYNALVDASIYIATKDKAKNTETIYLWSNNIYKAASDSLRALRIFHNSEEQPVRGDNFSVYKSIEKTWKPLSFQSLSLRKKLNQLIDLRRQIPLSENIIETSLFIKISDLFFIRQGVRTGNNEVFIIDKSLYQNRLSESEKIYFRPSVSNKSVNKGVLNDSVYIWFPYGNELTKIRTESDLKNNCPYFYERSLKPNKEALKNRSLIDNWWDLSRYYRWNYDKVNRLVSTEFGKSGSFAFDKTGEFIVERGHGWLPKFDLTESQYLSYLAFFNSPFFDELLKIYSKQIPGGSWWYLGNKFVKDIPIPNFISLGDQDIIKSLSKYGKNIAMDIPFNYENLKNLISQIYGL